MTDVVVLLAAGAGSRFRPAPAAPDAPRHKLLAPMLGGTVVRRAVEAARDADIGPVLVVWGAVDLRGALDRLDDGQDGRPSVELVEHPGWAEGQASSLAAGIAAAGSRGHDRVVVGLGDQPGVGVAAWRAVATAPDAPVVAARFGGVVTPPVRLDHTVWPLLPKDGDVGARRLFDQFPGIVQYVDVAGDPADIDTVEDLQRWS